MQNFPPHTPISSPQLPFCPFCPLSLLHLLRKQGCPSGNKKIAAPSREDLRSLNFSICAEFMACRNEEWRFG